MSTAAIKLTQRASSKFIFNKLCFYSNRSLSTLNNVNKFHTHSTSAHYCNSLLTCNCRKHHICTPQCRHVLRPNTIHIRYMSTTQDKDNDAAQPDTDDNQEETEEEEEYEEPTDSQQMEAANEQIGELQSKIEDLQSELKKYQDALARSHADIINIQNMSKKDVESAKKFAIKGFSKDLLNVADALEGCIKVVDQHLNEYKNDQNELDDNIQSVIQGVKLTHGTLLDTFGRHGIAKIESLHKEFDPNLHEALFKQPTDEHPEDTVVTVISEGYTIKDAVLRAAKVGVSAPAPQAQTSNDAEETEEK